MAAFLFLGLLAVCAVTAILPKRKRDDYQSRHRWRDDQT
jgi:hypothetical protein